MKNYKIFLLAFSTTNLKLTINRFKDQAKHSKYFSDIKVFTNKSIDNFLKKKINVIRKSSGNRGYGYWIWKPYLILNEINNLDKNDIIIYLDIGCHIISDKKKRFDEYLNFLRKGNDILGFQYFHPSEKSFEKIKFPNREEYKYTKADLLKYFNFLNNEKVFKTPQFWAGCIFFKKTDFSVSFLQEWIKVYENFSLIDDSPSKEKNFNNFIENRHDQSVYSLLCKKYNVKSLSAFECDWAEDQYGRNWDYTSKSPILAKRDLQYSIFKRFFNRQKKNLKRIFNKYI